MEEKRKMKERLKEEIDKISEIWFKEVYTTIVGSLMLLFLASIIFKNNSLLENINTWVSIILGIVATSFSIIGMALSFYNLEQTRESEKETRELLSQITQQVTKTNEIICLKEQKDVELRKNDEIDNIGT